VFDMLSFIMVCFYSERRCSSLHNLSEVDQRAAPMLSSYGFAVYISCLFCPCLTVSASAHSFSVSVNFSLYFFVSFHCFVLLQMFSYDCF
jgi:hypothetical protein